MEIFKGNIIFASVPEKFDVYEKSYIIVEEGKVNGIYNFLPEEYKNEKITDYGNNLIIPAFSDMHLHAPQYTQRGLGMDKQLLDWLTTYTFPNENKIADLNYAEKVYTKFVNDLYKNGIMRSVVFATIHKESTELLISLFEKKGLSAYVGKVNMDANCPDFLKEDTKKSLDETEELILKYKDNKKVKTIITPRFVPTSTEELLIGLGKLAEKYNIPVQSHLSENKDEIKWVHELYPSHHNYSRVYFDYGLFGQTPTLMAHCIYMNKDTIKLLQNNEVYAVHCPESNLNLSSGVMHTRYMMKEGIRVTLGSDIGAGAYISPNRNMVSAIQSSKIIYMKEKNEVPLKTSEVFYLATKAGGKFFGNACTFDSGAFFDALVIDDTELGEIDLSIEERLQRFIYIGDDRNITARYLEGNKI